MADPIDCFVPPNKLKAAPAGAYDCIETDKAALFLFLVDDIMGIEERLDATIGAPQRNGKAHQKAQSEFCLRLCQQTVQLIVQHVQRPTGQDTGKAVDMSCDRLRIANKAVDRDDCRRPGK